jgi:hypothetical protein
VTKDELRAELERQEQRYKDVYGGAFAQEIQKIEQELKTEEP